MMMAADGRGPPTPAEHGAPATVGVKVTVSGGAQAASFARRRKCRHIASLRDQVTAGYLRQ
jgi:hypothetical protein